MRPTFFASEVLDQRIKACILGNDVEIGRRILGGQLADVEGDMEIQGVGSVAGNLHVFGPCAHFLDCGRENEGQFRLTRPDKQENLEMFGVQSGQGFNVDVFVVDENEVRAQDGLP